MSEVKDGGVVSEGRRVIDSYLRAEQELASAKSQQNRAQCDFDNSRNALGKWLCPDNAKDGETFCIWHEGHMLQATKLDMHTFGIVVRQRAKP